MITAAFDLTAGWTFDGDPATDFGIRFTDGDADRLYPNALGFGWTVEVNGEETESLSWPPAHIVIRELTPSRVFPYWIAALPDDEVTLSVWASVAGVRTDGQMVFTIPRPKQPFPSWTWEDGAWTPPVPYPDDGEMYGWDEDAQGWTPVSVDG